MTLALLLLAMGQVDAPAQVDGGSDAPTVSAWTVVPRGTVLQEEQVCASTPVAMATAKGLLSCRVERDTALEEISQGGGSTARWAAIALAIGFAAGALTTGISVAAWCASSGCGKR